MEYSAFVKKLAKPGKDILAHTEAQTTELVHMAIGISGEAGELLDAIKKRWAYNKPLDINNVIEELGDIEFYMEGLRQVLGIDREDTIAQNMAKLNKRYENAVYSDEQAQARADKAEPTQLELFPKS